MNKTKILQDENLFKLTQNIKMLKRTPKRRNLIPKLERHMTKMC